VAFTEFIQGFQFGCVVSATNSFRLTQVSITSGFVPGNTLLNAYRVLQPLQSSMRSDVIIRLEIRENPPTLHVVSHGKSPTDGNKFP
jgi:hypothetical protein